MNETINSLVSRKSCRSFLDKHVEKSLIEKIVEAGLNAPSGMNAQTPIFVVVSDDKVVSKLSILNASVMGSDRDPFYGARDVIAVLARRERTYIYDGSLAMGNLMNAAWSLGVGSCWIHRAKEVFASSDGKALLADWGITDEVEGIGFLILGYPKDEKAKTVIKENRVLYIE